ncbi:mechanosensitive ion channel family protein [Actinokineospora sp. HUAS TT18]|uniref:mechanosensitive ion channel family protein n=1 Tax=Actinokineospora sp. HUAS TT18 TaxID=3447451 RepID=UPI003F5232F5
MANLQVAAVDFGQGLSDAWSAVITFVPRLLAFLVILLIGWFIAKALAKAVNYGLEKVGFDRVVERGGLKQTLARSKLDASDIIAKLVYYAVLLIALQFAFAVFGPNPVSALLTDIVAWLPKAAVAIIIIVVAGAIARVVRDMVTGALGSLSYGRTIGTIASVFIWGLGIIAALNQVEIATTVTTPVLIAILATVAGVAIVGVGGGLVRPMQSRWEGWLNRAEHEIPVARREIDQHRDEVAARKREEARTPVAHGNMPPMGTPGTHAPMGTQPPMRQSPQPMPPMGQQGGAPRPGPQQTQAMPPGGQSAPTSPIPPVTRPDDGRQQY